MNIATHNRACRWLGGLAVAGERSESGGILVAGRGTRTTAPRSDDQRARWCRRVPPWIRTRTSWCSAGIVFGLAVALMLTLDGSLRRRLAGDLGFSGNDDGRSRALDSAAKARRPEGSIHLGFGWWASSAGSRRSSCSDGTSGGNERWSASRVTLEWRLGPRPPDCSSSSQATARPTSMDRSAPLRTAAVVFLAGTGWRLARDLPWPNRLTILRPCPSCSGRDRALTRSPLSTAQGTATVRWSFLRGTRRGPRRFVGHVRQPGRLTGEHC